MKLLHLMAFCFLICLSSCIWKKEQTDESKVFRYNEAAGITSLDPAFSRTFENLWAVNQLFEGLVQLDEEMRVIPCIAHSWDIENEGLRYVFHLRDDVYFHANEDFEARKVTADDFKYSFERVNDEKTASPGKWVFNIVESFSVADERTFIIDLKEVFPPFLGILSMKYCSVVPKEAIELYGDDFRSKPVGSGPFQFRFWEENVLLAFTRNADYYGKDESGASLPYLDAVSISFKKDQNGVFLDFLKGSYDMLQGIEGSYKEELLDENGILRDAYKGKLVLDKSPWLKTDYLGFLLDSQTVESNPFSDIRVRQAVNHAIDRKMLCKVLLRNLGDPAIGGFLPKGFSTHAETMPAYSYDPSLSMSLLRDAGYGGNKPLQLVLSVTSAYADLSEFIQHQLADVGIDMQVNVMESGNLNEQVANAQLILFKKSWLADYPDEENFMALFYSQNFSPSGPNYTHFRHEGFDSLYVASVASVDPLERSVYNRQMDSIVAANHAVAPLFYGAAVKFLANSVSGLPSSPVNMLDLRKVKKEVSGS